MIGHIYNEKEKEPKYPGFFLKIYCYLFKKKMVKLTNYKGGIYFSYILGICDICGKLHCRVYPFTSVGDCILNEDGTVDPLSESFYIKRWELVK